MRLAARSIPIAQSGHSCGATLDLMLVTESGNPELDRAGEFAGDIGCQFASE